MPKFDGVDCRENPWWGPRGFEPLFRGRSGWPTTRCYYMLEFFGEINERQGLALVKDILYLDYLLDDLEATAVAATS